MNPRKEDTTYHFFLSQLWSKNNILTVGSSDNEAAKRGMLIGGGFGAGLAIRGGFFRTLFAGAVLVPAFATLGLFGNVALTRRYGSEKADELIDSSLKNAVAARDYVAQELKSFGK